MELQARRLRRRDLQALMTRQDQKWVRSFGKHEIKARDIAAWTPAKIIERLNGNSKSLAVKRVSRFIKLFNRARDLHASFRLFFEDREDMCEFLSQKYEGAVFVGKKDSFGTGWKFKFPEMQAHDTELNKLLAELNTMTRRYKWNPFIRHMGYELMDFDVTENWTGGNAEHEWETHAIWWLCGRNGKWIENFRQCKECDRWFFALAEHQSYCTDSCRKRHASQSDEFKEKRRLYMLRYRQSEKEGNIRAKAAAKIKVK